MTSAAEVTFDSDAVDAYLRAVSKRYGEIEKRAPTYVETLSAIVFKDVMQHFDREEGPDGAWAPWSASYAKFMASIGKASNKKLQFSGKLKAAFRPTNVKVSTEGITWFNDAKTAKGFPYALAHNTGTVKMPRRMHLWLSKEAEEEMAKKSLAYLES